MPTDISLTSLTINELESKEVYKFLKENNLLKENELYLLPDEEVTQVVDAKPTAGSTNLVYSGGVHQALIENNWKTTIKKATVTLLATEWVNNEQIVEVLGLASDEDTQFIHILPVDNETYTSCEVVGTVYAENQMKFTAATVPEVDLEVNIVMQDMGELNPEDPYELFTGSQAKRFLVNVPVNWTLDETVNAYYQELEVSGMSKNYEPICDYLPSNSLTDTAAAKEAWGCITMVETFNERIKLWAESAPSTQFTLRMNVLGWYQIGEEYTDAEGVEF